MNKKLFVVSLGCPKNLVDSELMLGALEQAGFEACQEAEVAGVIVVNTCGFIQSAVEEAVDEILRLGEIKNKFPEKVLVVTGCLVQRYGGDLQKELPEVDIFLGVDGFVDVVRQIKEVMEKRTSQMQDINKPDFLMNASMPRRISTPKHRAYLKISEGCSNRCSYCLIPTLRGRLRSRQIADLVEEAKKLEALGVKELTLVGQDLTAYGVDFGKGPLLPQLLEQLLEQTNIPWLRMLYLYPNLVTDGLLDLMAAHPRLLPYFDIPLQHVSERILGLMKRPYSNHNIEQLISRIRSKLPNSAIRTTFIVGFPGETENDLIQLEEFVSKARLNHVGVFAYSNEEGCAAAKLPGHCGQEDKERRKGRILAKQAVISAAIHQKMVGSVVDVLVEGLSSETDLLLEGRTMHQAPEIDGSVYINSGECQVGDIVKVKISESHTYNVIGEILADKE